MTNRGPLSSRIAAWAGLASPRRSVSPADLERKPEFLKAMEIFAPLSQDQWTWLLESTAMITCERGRVFYQPDDLGETLFIVKRGKVSLYRLTSDGRKLVTDTLGPFTIFGEMGLIGQRMYGCYAEASEDSLICVLSRSDMQDLIRQNPEVALLLLAEVERRAQERESELEALAFRGLPARLAALLLREATSDGEVRGVTHQELAERLGTYRETVSQVLGKFREEGMIVTAPKRIELLDMDALRRQAEDA
jgi:CRP/FNR family transcriptional regulator, cyclic AMP receptor protein